MRSKRRTWQWEFDTDTNVKKLLNCQGKIIYGRSKQNNQTSAFFLVLLIVIPHHVWDPLGRRAKYSGRLVSHELKYRITRCHNSVYHSIKNKLAALRTPHLTTLHHCQHHDFHHHHHHQLVCLGVKTEDKIN